jgi:hypothetical protein
VKNLCRKKLWVLLLIVVPGIVSAHTQTGSLGKKTTGAAATDVYSASCFDDDGGAGVPSKIYVHIKDNAPKLTPAISVQVIKGGLATTPSIDAIDGDATYGPAVSLAKGPGDYTILVNKSASTVKGTDSYSLEFHCQSANGGHAGTDISMSQNQ